MAKSAEYMMKTNRPSISLDGNLLSCTSGHSIIKVYCPPTTTVERVNCSAKDTLTQTTLGWEAKLFSADWAESLEFWDGLRFEGIVFQIDIENKAPHAGGPCHFYKDGEFLKNDYEYTYEGFIA